MLLLLMHFNNLYDVLCRFKIMIQMMKKLLLVQYSQNREKVKGKTQWNIRSNYQFIMLFLHHYSPPIAFFWVMNIMFVYLYSILFHYFKNWAKIILLTLTLLSDATYVFVGENRHTQWYDTFCGKLVLLHNHNGVVHSSFV